MNHAKQYQYVKDTRDVWRQTERNLKECCGPNRDLRTIDETMAEDFKIFLLKEKLAPTTIAKRLQFAKQFFRAAVKRKLIPANPFAEVTAKATMNPDRERFVTREETAKLLAACRNIDWRVIVALCRFGGLRCPSEVLTLKWADIKWKTGRFRIHSPKTEHHPGKETREAPLFPELRAILEEAWAAAEKGAVHVVANDAYRKAADTRRVAELQSADPGHAGSETGRPGAVAASVPRPAGVTRDGACP